MSRLAHLHRPMLALILHALAAMPSAASPARSPVMATHLMFWQSSSEPWWNPGNSSGYRVVSPGGEKRSIDWLNTTLVPFYMDQVRGAGFDAVIVDLTNEFSKFLARAPTLLPLCAQRGLRLAAQVAGQPADVEAHARDVWNVLVNDTGMATGTTYLRVGAGASARPVLVAYVTRGVWDELQRGASNGTLPWAARFSLHWSSGEDSNPGKWGWQIEPFVGPEPSTSAVFVTASTGHRSAPGTFSDRWRKGLENLDYAMLVARRSDPGVVIVGSYDDVVERNAWLVADTAGAPPERQMRGHDGALSATAYYDRVKAWVQGWESGHIPAAVPGGELRDGAYVIRPSSSSGAAGAGAGTLLAMQGNDGRAGAPLVRAGLASAPPLAARAVAPPVPLDSAHWFESCTMCGRNVCTPACEPHCCVPVADNTFRANYAVGATVAQMGCDNATLPVPGAPLVCNNGKIYGVQNGTGRLFWLYHVGDNAYRVLPLGTGLALQLPAASGDPIAQQLPSSSTAQHWRVRSVAVGVRDEVGAGPRAASSVFRVSSLGGDGEWQLGTDGVVVLAAAGTNISSIGVGVTSQFKFEAVATL